MKILIDVKDLKVKKTNQEMKKRRTSNKVQLQIKWKSGTIMEKKSYRNGKPLCFKTFYRNGNPRTKRFFNNGKRIMGPLDPYFIKYDSDQQHYKQMYCYWRLTNDTWEMFKQINRYNSKNDLLSKQLMLWKTPSLLHGDSQTPAYVEYFEGTRQEYITAYCIDGKLHMYITAAVIVKDRKNVLRACIHVDNGKYIMFKGGKPNVIHYDAAKYGEIIKSETRFGDVTIDDIVREFNILKE